VFVDFSGALAVTVLTFVAVAVERFYQSAVMPLSFLLAAGFFAVLAICYLRGTRRNVRFSFVAAIAVTPVYALLLRKAPEFILMYLLLVATAFILVEIIQNRYVRERLRVLEYSREIGEAHEPRDACRRASDFIIESLGYQIASVLLYEKESDALVLRAVSGADTPITHVPRGKGVTWRAFLSGSQQIVPDTTVDPDYVTGIPGIRSEMVTPIMWKDKLFGVLNVESRVRNVFSASDARMMELLSGILGQAIHRLGTESAIRDEFALQQKLAGVNRAIFEMFHGMAGASSIEELTRCVVDGMTERMGYSKMFIYLRDSGDERFRLAASRGRNVTADLMGMVFNEGRGIAGRVLETGEPYMTNDAMSDPWFVDDDLEVLSEIVAPVQWKETLYGLVVVDSYSRGAFTGQDVEMITLIATHLALEIDNIRFSIQAERGYRTMKLLNDVPAKAVAASDIQTMCQSVVDFLSTKMGYKVVGVFAVSGEDPETGFPMLDFMASNLHAVSELPEVTEKIREMGGGLSARAARTMEIQNTPDVTADPDYAGLEVSVSAELDVPILYGEKLLGVLSVEGEKPFDRQDVETFSVMAGQLGALWRVRELMSRLERQALVDPLTGLWNRRYGAKAISSELSRAKRSGAAMVVAMIDLTAFKAVNDTLGHTEGDRVLQKVSEAFVECARKSDVVVRWGGDEFLVILPETQMAKAEKVMKRMSQSVGGIPDVPRGLVPGVDFGMAEFPSDGGDEENLVRIADRRLYEKKRAR